MPNCELCGQPMPEGEEMFKYHGLSGQCPVNEPSGGRMNHKQPNAETRTRVEGECQPPAVFSDPVQPLEGSAEAAKEAAKLADKLLALRSSLNPIKHKTAWDEMTNIAAKIRSLATPPAPQPSEAEREAIARPINMQDIRLIAGEGKLPQWALIDAFNIILRQRADAILARRSAPSEAEVIERCAKVIDREVHEAWESEKHYASMNNIACAIAEDNKKRFLERIASAIRSLKGNGSEKT